MDVQVSTALLLSPDTGHVSPKFHVVFDDDFSRVPFMREGAIPQILIDLVQRRSQSGTTDNNDLKDTLFIPYLQ